MAGPAYVVAAGHCSMTSSFAPGPSSQEARVRWEGRFKLQLPSFPCLCRSLDLWGGSGHGDRPRQHGGAAAGVVPPLQVSADPASHRPRAGGGPPYLPAVGHVATASPLLTRTIDACTSRTYPGPRTPGQTQRFLPRHLLRKRLTDHALDDFRALKCFMTTANCCRRCALWLRQSRRR